MTEENKDGWLARLKESVSEKYCILARFRVLFASFHDSTFLYSV